MNEGMKIGNIIGTKNVNVGQAAVRRNLNVENAASDLDNAVAGLREAVEALEHHLAPLLLPECPCGPGCDRTPGESELSERILYNADAIRGRSARIRELIERL